MRLDKFTSIRWMIWAEGSRPMADRLIPSLAKNTAREPPDSILGYLIGLHGRLRRVGSALTTAPATVRAHRLTCMRIGSRCFAFDHGPWLHC
jgi:hypothetical protein